MPARRDGRHVESEHFTYTVASDTGADALIIASEDYTAIEVSTPELDDVIRWQDDTDRGSGRLDHEHNGGAR